MKFSRSIHLLANNILSLFFMADYNSVVYKYHILLIHSSVVGYLGCFHSLAIINSAAVNMGVQLALSYHGCTYNFVYVPRTGITGSCSIFSFEGTSIWLSIAVAVIYIPSNSVELYNCSFPHPRQHLFFTFIINGLQGMRTLVRWMDTKKEKLSIYSDPPFLSVRNEIGR
jgi:hypothetical protein